jgi:signal transduction histidine kinase
MHFNQTLVGLAQAPHLRSRTVRMRLTLLYGGLFLLSGAALLAITYVLVVKNTSGFIFNAQSGSGALVTFHSGSHRPQSGTRQVTVSGKGARLPPKQAEAQAQQLQAQATQQHSAVLHQLLVQSMIALAGMSALSILLGWIVAGRVLRPLRTITTTARDISATNLHQRLALTGPRDELKELGDTIDGLLARLEAAFRAQRRFVANASHELRTPLARQRTIAQVALADPQATAQALRIAHEKVLASGAEQEQLIDALLTLARSQAGIDKPERFDLATLAQHALLTRGPEAERLGLTVYASLSTAPAAGDPRLVERLIANLIDNALRHNVPDGWVEVRTRTRAGQAFISVINTGPVIPAEAVERLLEPFKRLRPDRTGHRDGTGLGLSIVQAIADAHHAALTVHPQPDGGLRVQASFPQETLGAGSQTESTVTTSSSSDRETAIERPAGVRWPRPRDREPARVSD